MPDYETLEEHVLAYLKSPRYEPQDASGLARGLNLNSKERPALRELLRQWEAKGTIIRLKQSRYILREVSGDEQPSLEGRMRQLPSGKLLFLPHSKHHADIRKLIPGDGRIEFIVPAFRSLGAMDGDLVSARLRISPPSNYKRRNKGRPSQEEMRPEVKIDEILQRRVGNWVGIYRATGRFGTVCGDGKSSPSIISLTQAPPPGLLAGMLVVVESQSYPRGKMEATGRIIEQLGWPEDSGVNMRALIKKHNLADVFPESVLEETLALPREISEKDLHDREDWTKECVITIDPDTARDFDDAISVRKLEDGNWELAVHIADVSHYVKPNSALDREAQKRGNSTYLPDRVLPMLPPRLCDDLCSLKEGVPRLTQLCCMKLNKHGQVIAEYFSAALICSRKRFDYGQVLELIEGRIPSLADAEIDTMLRNAYELSLLMRAARFEAGALELDMPQVQIKLDDEGVPIDIELEKSDAAHALIEEFMLAANETVAHALREKMLPCVYRVHENPDSGKLNEFASLARQYGVKCGLINSHEELNHVARSIKGLPDEMLLKLALLRSLMRARYSEKPLGHFGLAKGDYCHFTSPIRRYADLIVHRAFTHLYSTKENPPLPKPSKLVELAEHISETERISASAEQEARKMKLMEYMQIQCESDSPRVWQAIITACWPQGMALELPELQLKGFVSGNDLAEGSSWYYESHSNRWSSVTGQSYLPGDLISVIPIHVDEDSGFIDFKPQQVQ